MYLLNSVMVSGFFLLALSSCNQQAAKNNVTTVAQVPSSTTLVVDGNYVTPDYEKRNEGYDWVGITVQTIAKDKIAVKIRSRGDKKKPTCTLDAQATKTEGNSYRASLEGKGVLFTFDDTSLTIAAENLQDSDMLRYYCSGGASIAETYKKTPEPLDSTQVDQTIFQKVLSLQNITFSVVSRNKDGKVQLSIIPIGLGKDNSPVYHDITGQTILNAEIEDMNSDGYPELIIYTQSHGSGSYGNVIGYSVNNGQSMSQIYFPQPSENPKINQGYLGHDEFTLIERSLAQRFPIHKNGDTNAKPSGKIRQIEYELKDGEASRKLVVKKISEY